jgi:hypothetical protein
MKMIQLRGGVEKLWRECPHLRNGILMMMV